MKLTSRLLQNRKQKNLNEEPKEKKQDKLRILVVSSGALKSERDKTPIFHTARRFKEESEKLYREQDEKNKKKFKKYFKQLSKLCKMYYS